MKRLLTMAVLMAAAGMVFGLDMTLPAPKEASIAVSTVRLGSITINLDALTGSQTNRPAIVAPFQWVDSTGKVTREGTAKIYHADIVAALGAQTEATVGQLLQMVAMMTNKAVTQ